MAFHLEKQIEENMAAGMSAEEAWISQRCESSAASTR